MDDGTTLLPISIDCHTFLSCLNNLHPSIVYTLEPAKQVVIKNELVQTLEFLDVTVILHSNGIIESDVHYKPTNSHQYLNYESFHPLHCKNNIPFNLAKRIIVFVTCSEKMEFRLRELKLWLLKCNYPETIIDKGFHNARLQGPAPKPISKNNIIPFVTTYMSNLDTKPTMNSIRTLISDKKFGQLHNVFKDANVVVGYKQPKSLAKLLTKAKFSNTKLHKTESM